MSVEFGSDISSLRRRAFRSFARNAVRSLHEKMDLLIFAIEYRYVANISIFTLIYCRVNVVMAAFAHYLLQMEQMLINTTYIKSIYKV